jgi:two-component system nitrate/nitrite response regulator NarL
MIKIAIADDYQSVIDGVRHYMDALDSINVIGTANNQKDLIILAKNKNPDVIILPVVMTKLNGIDATKQILKNNPDTKVIAFSNTDKQDNLRMMIGAGASGYVLKNSKLEVLLKAVKTVIQGKVFIDPQLNMVGFNNHITTAKPKLTKRQLQILKLIGEGKSSKDIALELCIGVYTVNTHRKNIARKLKLNGRGQLLKYALEMKYKL